MPFIILPILSQKPALTAGDEFAVEKGSKHLHGQIPLDAFASLLSFDDSLGFHCGFFT